MPQTLRTNPLRDLKSLLANRLYAFTAMILLVGLGNPGAEYQFTRHNIGFLSLDTLQEDNHFSPWKEKFKGLVSEGTIGNQKILLLKPQTYMNLSGQSVSLAMQFYKITPENVIVIHDDLDLDPGKVRMKQGGGHGGHNGLRDIDKRIGKNYWRIRLGIGHPRTLKQQIESSGKKDPKFKVSQHPWTLTTEYSHSDALGSTSNYVLGKFSKQDTQWLGPLLDSVSYQLPLFLEGEPEKFVSKVMQDLSTLK